MMATGTNPYAISTETFSAATPFDQMAFATPNYAGALTGMASLFADIGKNVALVQAGNRQLALDQQNLMMANRNMMHTQTMELMEANRKAEESRFNQSLEAMRLGIEMQKNRYTLETMQRQADEAFGVADYEKRHLDYEGRLQQAVAGDDYLGLFKLKNELAAEPYLLRSENGRELNRILSEHILRAPDSEGVKMLARMEKGDIQALQSAATLAKTPDDINVLVAKTMKDYGFTEAGAREVLNRKPNILTPEEFKQMNNIIAEQRAETYKKIALAEEIGDDADVQRLQTSQGSFEARIKASFYYPGQSEHADKPSPQALIQDVESNKNRIRGLLQFTQATSVFATPEMAAVRQVLDNPDRRLVPANAVVVGRNGKEIPYADASYYDRAQYMRDRFIAQGDIQNAERFKQIVDIGAKPPSESDFTALYDRHLDASGALDVKQWNATLKGIQDTMSQRAREVKPLEKSGATRAAEQAITAFIAPLMPALPGQIEKMMSTGKEVYSPEGPGIFSGIRNQLTGLANYATQGKYLTKADLDKIEQDAAMAKYDRLAGDFVNSTAASYQYVTTAGNRATPQQLAAMLSQYAKTGVSLNDYTSQWGVEPGSYTALEQMTGPLPFKRFVQSFERRTQIPIQNILPSDLPSGMTYGSTGAVPPAPAGGAGQASWATGIRPTGASQQP